MNITVTEGDLLNQDVDVIVNLWNHNITSPSGCSCHRESRQQELRWVAEPFWIPLPVDFILYRNHPFLQSEIPVGHPVSIRGVDQLKCKLIPLQN